MDDKQSIDEMTSPGRRKAGVVMSRRSFTRAGLSGSVILGSLASKPVLGAGPQCTVSGQVSGNLSRAGSDDTCDVGYSPAQWLEMAWPAPFIKGSAAKCDLGGQDADGTVFSGFGPDGVALADAFVGGQTASENGKECSSDPSSGVGSFTVTRTQKSQALGNQMATNRATMLQVLASMNSGDDEAYLGGVVVASLLNAAEFGREYPVKMNTVIEMFNAVHSGFEYPITDTQSWDRARVVQYLEGLYQ